MNDFKYKIDILRFGKLDWVKRYKFHYFLIFGL